VTVRAHRIVWAAVAALALLGTGRARPPQLQQKDYLTPLEAEKIRNAETPSQKVKLFLAFAADRLKRFETELKRSTNAPHHDEILNDLLNGYSGCVDDAADRIQDALDRQEDVREGIREMRAEAPKFLEVLKKIKSSSAGRAAYKDTLEDAIEATQDAASDAEKAARQLEPAAPRRNR